jgi:hypothetical protein
METQKFTKAKSLGAKIVNEGIGKSFGGQKYVSGH